MTVWGNLARTYGRRAVMSPDISEDELEAETTRQIEALTPMLRPLFYGIERSALDFGCGSARMLPLLLRLAPTAWRFTCYEPCGEMLALAPANADRRIVYSFDLPSRPHDVVFAFIVLGDPGLDPERTAIQITRLLAPDGLLILADHMPSVPPVGAWWRFRPQSYYIRLFAALGVSLELIGTDRQLDKPITILAGRKP